MSKIDEKSEKPLQNDVPQGSIFGLIDFFAFQSQYQLVKLRKQRHNAFKR